VPPALRGLGITFIITGLMAIGFMSFGGMLTGGASNDKSDVISQEAIQKIQNEVEGIVDNSKN
jgi:Na+-transporting NADH:ubiquinone oxidoreductase subunit E